MGKIVPAEGPPDAEIMLIGQNPGSTEAAVGRPFAGRAGRYLDGVLRKNGIDRARLYITSVVRETTPRNRRPAAAEIKLWMPSLLSEIKKVRPNVVVLMGRVAWRVPRAPGIEYIETVHPAAAMRFPAAKARFEHDFAALRARLSSGSLKPRQELFPGGRH